LRQKNQALVFTDKKINHHTTTVGVC
jgi:hypothetical protein